MKPIKLSTIIVLVIIGTFGLSDVCSAIMFTNMGGGVKAQSAKGGSAFLQATGATYLMFAKIETATIGDRAALMEAKKQANRSVEYLRIAITEFKSIRAFTKQLDKLTSAMTKSERYDVAVQEAAVFLKPKVEARIKTTALKEGAVGLLNLSIHNMEALMSSKSSMGKTYEQIAKGRIPDAGLLWAAGEELDIALQIGRVVSSLLGQGTKR